MIAIPDFSAGAMENWGLITYRETALLYKEGKTTTQRGYKKNLAKPTRIVLTGVSAAYNKRRIAVVISHELAHQWFGNLVRMIFSSLQKLFVSL